MSILFVFLVQNLKVLLKLNKIPYFSSQKLRKKKNLSPKLEKTTYKKNQFKTAYQINQNGLNTILEPSRPKRTKSKPNSTKHVAWVLLGLPGLLNI